jgi:site-specific DNA-methyltransferase (adenine-specific)
MIKLYKGDCLIESDKIKSGSVDLILTDLPYGTVKDIKYPNQNRKGYDTTAKWDITIATNEIYKIANRILRKNGKMVLFAQQPFTTELINKAIPNLPFNYGCIWEKDNFANALFVNKACVGYYEDILVFSKNSTDENDFIRKYLRDEKAKSGLTNKDFNNLFSDYTNKKGNRDRSVLEHYWGKSQHGFPTEEIYNNVLQPTGFFKKTYKELKEENKKYESTFNLWEGKKYKSNIFKHKKEYNGQHPTQKPILLLEDLIKTFSNESDLVVDLTMGSGSTGVACVNTNRDFIGIEMNDEYFNIATARINKEEPQKELF